MVWEQILDLTLGHNSAYILNRFHTQTDAFKTPIRKKRGKHEKVPRCEIGSFDQRCRFPAHPPHPAPHKIFQTTNLILIVCQNSILEYFAKASLLVKFQISISKFKKKMWQAPAERVASAGADRPEKATPIARWN